MCVVCLEVPHDAFRALYDDAREGGVGEAYDTVGSIRVGRAASGESDGRRRVRMPHGAKVNGFVGAGAVDLHVIVASLRRLGSRET